MKEKHPTSNRQERSQADSHCIQSPLSCFPLLHNESVDAFLGDLRVQGVAGAAVVRHVPGGALGGQLSLALAEVLRSLYELAAQAAVPMVAGTSPRVAVHVLLQLALVGEPEAADGANDPALAGAGAAHSTAPAPQLSGQLLGQGPALLQRLLQPSSSGPRLGLPRAGAPPGQEEALARALQVLQLFPRPLWAAATVAGSARGRAVSGVGKEGRGAGALQGRGVGHPSLFLLLCRHLHLHLLLLHRHRGDRVLAAGHRGHPAKLRPSELGRRPPGCRGRSRLGPRAFGPACTPPRAGAPPRGSFRAQAVFGR